MAKGLAKGLEKGREEGMEKEKIATAAQPSVASVLLRASINSHRTSAGGNPEIEKISLNLVETSGKQYKNERLEVLK